jgi:hypothetical protein
MAESAGRRKQLGRGAGHVEMATAFDLGRRRAAAAPALHCPVRLRLDLDPVHRNKI